MKIWSIFHNKIRSVCNLISVYFIHSSIQPSICLSIHSFIHQSICPSIQITFIHFRLSLGESCVLGSLLIRPSCMWLSVFSSYSAEQKRDDKSKGKNSWHFLLLITLKNVCLFTCLSCSFACPKSRQCSEQNFVFGVMHIHELSKYIYIYISHSKNWGRTQCQLLN